jgi:predicted translin family RNA/ssDNA-binding protein
MLLASLKRTIFLREQRYGEWRRSLQTLSTEILAASKRAIFAFHRGNPEAAEQELELARTRLAEGWKLVAEEPLLRSEGSWRAAREEYTEADFLSQFLEQHKINRFDDQEQDPDIFIGGLADAVGELVRQAVLLATKRDVSSIEIMYEAAQEIVEFLLEMDLTGTQRTKTDQAKQHLRKLEEIRYDLALRTRS